MIAVVAIFTIPGWGPLRDPETGAIIGNTPFMDSLIFIITLIFLVAGICYGKGAKTLSGSNDVIAGVTKTFAGLSGLVFMLLMISQFIAYFNYTNMPRVAAVEMAAPAGTAPHRPAAAAGGVHPGDRAPRLHHPRRGPQVGDLRPGVHPDLPQAGRGAPDRCSPPTGSAIRR